ncbi:hypothetical protein KI387_043180, partial [Taxus chinensis]
SINTMGGCVAMCICDTMGVDCAMVWVVDEGTTDTTCAREIADTVVMAGMGTSCETTGGEVGEGNAALLGADAIAVKREVEIDTGMP